MGLIGSFVRFIVSIGLFIAVLVLGIVFSGQLISAFGNMPGTITVGNVQVPLLASIVASLVLTLVVNLIAIPFRRSS